MKISDLPPSFERPGKEQEIEIPALPRDTTLRQIYSDFIKYLYSKTKKFFIESSPGGRNVWNRLEHSIILIFCIPNGWDLSQQSFIRDAVIDTGLVGVTEADDRIEFITEGEASVHYTLVHTSNMRWLNKGTIFTVIDAGGSTIDSTLYECKSIQPLRLEEVCASECVQAGGVFIDRAARRMLEEKLGDSPFNEDEYLKEMVQEFERKTKRLFDGTQGSNVIQFGRARDNDRAHGIIKGRLELTAAEVSGTFDETVTRTLESCTKLFRGRKVQHHLLVGGFGDSPFLRRRLSESFTSQGADIVTVDEPLKKAAAEGSVIWYLKQLVTARAIRFTIGAEADVLYVPSSQLHRSRPDLVHLDDRGVKHIYTYEPWIRKNAPLTEDWTAKFQYHHIWKRYPNYSGRSLHFPVYACDQDVVPDWTRSITGGIFPGIRVLCNIEASFDDLMRAIRPAGSGQNVIWYMNLEVVLYFSGTKIRGKLRWQHETGNWEEGPASILPGVVY